MPKMVRQMSARLPTTPPTIAPVLFDVGCELDEETAVGEEENVDVDDKEDDVVVGDMEVAVVEELDVEELEVEVVIAFEGTGMAKY
jgi:hypothetical protein